MRIAFIVGTPPKKLGSLEQWVLGVAAELRRRGHGLDLFTLLPVHAAVQQELDRLGVVHRPLESLQGSRLEAVRTLRGYDLLFVNMVQPRSRVALACYAAWPAKVVVVAHGSAASEEERGPVHRQLSRALDRVTLLRVEELVGVSEYVRRREAERFGVSRRRSRVIYNGVDPQRFTVDKTPNPGGALRLLCVAQLIPEKGIDVLLRALTLTRVRDFTLRVAGYGRMERPYRALVKELGLEGRVEFLGMRDDVHLLVRDADVFVHPATWQEAFGLTVTEGMVGGCGVIATYSGGIPEIIDHGEDGLLVPRGDAGALAAAIDRMALEPGLRQRLGAAARRKVERRFTLSRCILEHVDCIERVGGAQVRKLPERGVRTVAARQSASGGERR